MHQLLVIGHPTKPDRALEFVAETVGAGGPVLHVERCRGANELLAVVSSVARAHGPLDILDLHDHGRPGRILMGDGVLFESDDAATTRLTNAQVARDLAPYLTETAHVRLLGCNTAGLSESSEAAFPGVAGRLLLLKLAAELGGHRTVFSTIDWIDDSRFDRNGFTAEKSFLFSSLAALDMASPPIDTRRRSLAKLLKDYPGRR